MARRQRPHQHLADLLAETRRIARRNKRKLGSHLLAEITALQGEAKNALASGDEARIARATAALESAASKHLEGLRRSFAREAFEMVLVALLLAVAVRLFVVEAFRIPSGSMVPTLLPGDVVLVDKSAYGVRLPGGTELLPGALPARGEVIVFENPAQAGEVMIKRVAGLPGDVITLVDERVHIGGLAQPRQLVAERFDYWNYRDELRYWHPQSGNLYLEELGGRRYATIHSRLLPRPRPGEGPFEVPAGHLFVLGDNRDDSADGRTDGGWYVPLAAVRGRASIVALSWGRGGLWPWGDEGLRFGRILRAVDGQVVQPGALPLHDAAASLRLALEEEGVAGPAAPPEPPAVAPAPAPERERQELRPSRPRPDALPASAPVEPAAEEAPAPAEAPAPSGAGSEQQRDGADGLAAA
ncbi:signal peptidase I [Vulgatibacter sp.]|uniref:signal peptidase I n=1 Tax=Vulgatibacter sp. TaxID=1971226 RepID=UPI003568CA95